MIESEIIQGLGDVPHLFSRRSIAGKAVNGIYAGHVAISHQEAAKLDTVVEILKSPSIDDLVSSGRMTLGMIKPQVGTALNLPINDDEAAKVLLQEIDPSKIVFNFSYKFTSAQTEIFYALIKEQYQHVITPIGDSIWESLYNFAPSGPLSIMLLHNEEGDTVQWWRNRMGNTQPGKAAKDSIRGRHAVQEMLPNNLVHGSGSVEEAKREIGLVAEILAETSAQLKQNAKNLPSDELLQDLGFLPPTERFIFAERIHDSGMRGESYICGNRIASMNNHGDLINRYLKEYHVISLGGCSEKARDLQKRYDELDALGVLQPKLYGVRRAALYRDYILNDGTTGAIRDLAQANQLSHEQRRYLNQLIEIGAKLDRGGFKPLGFMGDVIFDDDKKKFFFSDLGFDLGGSTDTLSSVCLKQLVSRFPAQQEYIAEKYHQY